MPSFYVEYPVSLPMLPSSLFLCLSSPRRPRRPLGVQGDRQRQAPVMCSPTKNVTSLAVLLFHTECERFLKRWISSLVQCRSLKASPFHGTPKKVRGQGERRCKGWPGWILSAALRTTASGYFYLHAAEVVIGDYLQKETGLVSAFLNSNIGLVYARTGFGNYFSFFAFILW